MFVCACAMVVVELAGACVLVMNCRLLVCTHPLLSVVFRVCVECGVPCVCVCACMMYIYDVCVPV